MKKKVAFLILTATALIISYLLAQDFSEGLVNDYYKNIIILIGINIILATSLNLINGFTGQFSLGHAGFMAVGGYFSITIATYFAPFWQNLFGKGIFGEAITFIILLFFSGCAAALVGVVVGVPSLRLKGDYLAIITLGFSEIIRVILQGLDVVGGAQSFSIVYMYENGTKSLQSVDKLGDMPFTVYQVPKYTNFFWTYFIVIIVIFVVYNLIKSTYGKGFIAVKDDEVAAESMGVNTTKYKIIAFVTGAFFAGIGGALLGHHTQTLMPEDFNFMRSVEIVVMVILGGMGSIYGVIIAAILLTILPELLRDPEISIVVIFSLPYLLFVYRFFNLKKEKFGKVKVSIILLISTIIFVIAIYFALPLMIDNIPNISTLRVIIYALLLIMIMLNRPQGLFGQKIKFKIPFLKKA